MISRTKMNLEEEDEAQLNKIVCSYLSGSGFETKGCLSAEEAYDEMYNQLYDMVISDIMMPGVDGYEALLCWVLPFF